MKAVSAQGAMNQNVDSSLSVAQWDYNDALAVQTGQYLGYAPWDGVPPMTAFVDGAKNAVEQSPAHLFFDIHATPTHAISAHTELVRKQDAVGHVSEPGSELLMLIALMGLAIMVRRKMPE
jgi:hypothetical protein